MKLIPRKKYLDSIESKIGQNMIICITGQRRVGKSSLLKTLRESLLQHDESNVIYIDKEKSRFDSIKDYKDLNSHIESNLDDSRHNYILIDEVQYIDRFEESPSNFYDEGNIDIIVTGSNAKMFSGELSTRLSGRYMTVHVGSLSYVEFLEFRNLENNDHSLNEYLNIGGLPNLTLLPADNPTAISDYLESIYSTIVLKDVIEREGVRNISVLENLTRFISDNIGKLISMSNISRYMLHEKEEIPAPTVRSYMRSLCNAYIINKVERWDIHGKQLLSSNDKYYFEDLGLRNILTSGNRKRDIEKLIENAVYLHLKGCGYKVNVGMLRNGEIDFVASRGNERIYFQVTYLLHDDATFEREFGNLQKIKDNYPKYVISMDPLYSQSSYEGINHISLRDFLTRTSF